MLQKVDESYASYLPAVLRPSSFDESLITSFEEITATLASEFKRLIGTAETLGGGLESLRLKLDTILEAVSLERKDIVTDRSRVLASLWTVLGGNRELIAEFDRNLELLLAIEDMRNDALQYVDRAMEAMTLSSDELEELAMRVAAPALVGGSIPMTDQLESIKESVERLDRSRRVALIPV